MKRRMLAVLCAFALLCTVTATAYAAVEAIDFSRKGTISLAMSYKGNPVPGGSMTAYRVAYAAKVDTGYALIYLAEYESSTYGLDHFDEPGMAQELSGITKEKGVAGIKKTIDGTGKVVFDGLELGLYLMVQEDPAPGYHVVEPFLVAVPGCDNEGHYYYEVDGSPKLALEPKPETPPPPELPDTGQFNWPVPVMGTAGAVLFFGGWLLRRSGKKKV